MVDPLFGQFAFEPLLRLQGAVDPNDRGPGQQDAQDSGQELQGVLLCCAVMPRGRMRPSGGWLVEQLAHCVKSVDRQREPILGGQPIKFG